MSSKAVAGREIGGASDDGTWKLVTSKKKKTTEKNKESSEGVPTPRHGVHGNLILEIPGERHLLTLEQVKNERSSSNISSWKRKQGYKERGGKVYC